MPSLLELGDGSWIRNRERATNGRCFELSIVRGGRALGGISATECEDASRVAALRSGHGCRCRCSRCTGGVGSGSGSAGCDKSPGKGMPTEGCPLWVVCDRRCPIYFRARRHAQTGSVQTFTFTSTFTFAQAPSPTRTGTPSDAVTVARRPQPVPTACCPTLPRSPCAPSPGPPAVAIRPHSSVSPQSTHHLSRQTHSCPIRPPKPTQRPPPASGLYSPPSTSRFTILHSRP